MVKILLRQYCLYQFISPFAIVARAILACQRVSTLGARIGRWLVSRYLLRPPYIRFSQCLERSVVCFLGLLAPCVWLVKPVVWFLPAKMLGIVLRVSERRSLIQLGLAMIFCSVKSIAPSGIALQSLTVAR